MGHRIIQFLGNCSSSTFLKRRWEPWCGPNWTLGLPTFPTRRGFRSRQVVFCSSKRHTHISTRPAPQMLGSFHCFVSSRPMTKATTPVRTPQDEAGPQKHTRKKQGPVGFVPPPRHGSLFRVSTLSGKVSTLGAMAARLSMAPLSAPRGESAPCSVSSFVFEVEQ